MAEPLAAKRSGDGARRKAGRGVPLRSGWRRYDPHALDSLGLPVQLPVAAERQLALCDPWVFLGVGCGLQGQIGVGRRWAHWGNVLPTPWGVPSAKSQKTRQLSELPPAMFLALRLLLQTVDLKI